jgi:ABC-type phosphate transport system substrate-binding protein
VTRRILSVLLALALLGPSAAWAADYQVVVHPNNPTDILTKEQLGKMFLKKLVKWDTGLPIVPVDQVPVSPARAAFTKIVHGKPVSAIASYWQQQIFAGREVPPAECPPSGKLWLHEIKHDGFRLIARKTEGRVNLYTKQGHDWAYRYARG